MKVEIDFKHIIVLGKALVVFLVPFLVMAVIGSMIKFGELIVGGHFPNEGAGVILSLAGVLGLILASVTAGELFEFEG